MTATQVTTIDSGPAIVTYDDHIVVRAGGWIEVQSTGSIAMATGGSLGGPSGIAAAVPAFATAHGLTPSGVELITAIKTALEKTRILTPT